MCFILMVPRTGFEPVTYGLATSTQFLEPPYLGLLVWTISSPFQVHGVWPLRIPLLRFPRDCRQQYKYTLLRGSPI